jgi:hypothetical protein
LVSVVRATAGGAAGEFMVHGAQRFRGIESNGAALPSPFQLRPAFLY